MSARVNFRIEALPVLLALAANAAAQSFLLVVLPSLGRDLGFSPLETGLLLGLAALILLIAAPIWGYVSERRGSRLVLHLGLVGATLGPALMSGVIGLRLSGGLDRVSTLALLFAIRVGQSSLAGGLLPAAQAWMADRTPPDRRAEGMGLLGASYGLGGIAGAGIAFAAGGAAPVSALAALAGGVALTLLFVWFTISDLSVMECADGPSASMGTLLGRIWPCLIVTFLGVTVYGIMQHVTALRLEDSFALSRAEAVSQAGAALMVATIAMAATQTFGLRFIKLAPTMLVLIGASAAVAAMLGVALAANAFLLTIALVVMGAALGLLLPGNLAALSLIAGPAVQGRVAGVNAMAQGLGMTAGPIAGAMLHRFSPLAAAFAAMAAMTMAAFIASIIWRSEQS